MIAVLVSQGGHAIRGLYPFAGCMLIVVGSKVFSNMYYRRRFLMSKLHHKLVSMFLIIVLVLSFGVEVFAAETENVEPRATCSHSWNTTTTYIEGQGRNATSTTCERRVVTTKTCSKCGQTNVTYSYTTAMPHGTYVLSASCDGKLQTITRKCKYCYTQNTTVQACPGVGHSGTCPYLPS